MSPRYPRSPAFPADGTPDTPTVQPAHSLAPALFHSLHRPSPAVPHPFFARVPPALPMFTGTASAVPFQRACHPHAESAPIHCSGSLPTPSDTAPAIPRPPTRSDLAVAPMRRICLRAWGRPLACRRHVTRRPRPSNHSACTPLTVRMPFSSFAAAARPPPVHCYLAAPPTLRRRRSPDATAPVPRCSSTAVFACATNPPSSLSCSALPYPSLHNSILARPNGRNFPLVQQTAYNPGWRTLNAGRSPSAHPGFLQGRASLPLLVVYAPPSRVAHLASPGRFTVWPSAQDAQQADLHGCPFTTSPRPIPRHSLAVPPPSSLSPRHSVIALNDSVLDVARRPRNYLIQTTSWPFTRFPGSASDDRVLPCRRDRRLPQKRTSTGSALAHRARRRTTPPSHPSHHDRAPAVYRARWHVRIAPRTTTCTPVTPRPPPIHITPLIHAPALPSSAAAPPPAQLALASTLPSEAPCPRAPQWSPRIADYNSANRHNVLCARGPPLASIHQHNPAARSPRPAQSPPAIPCTRSERMPARGTHRWSSNEPPRTPPVWRFHSYTMRQMENCLKRLRADGRFRRPICALLSQFNLHFVSLDMFVAPYPPYDPTDPAGFSSADFNTRWEKIMLWSMRVRGFLCLNSKHTHYRPIASDGKPAEMYNSHYNA
ncbi:hypothetical protein B0H14DRAFT_2632721 [Mycena olivaceomarginata]|nr:hypothetical protein B0H14DRAFT_2632721 [Mycena olivaceomarginata]